MKHRLSHQQTGIIQLTGLVITGMLPWVLVLVFINTLPVVWAVTGALLMNVLTFLFSLNLYKAEFDTSFLYLKRRLQMKKIPLENVAGIKTFPVPVSLFFGRAYLIKLTYTHEVRKRNAYIISRGLFSRTPTIDSLPEIRFFRQYLLDKKFSATAGAKRST